MTGRIIFVGMYYKTGLKALDSSTKSGKMVDRIMDKLPVGVKVKKSNLYDIARIPLDSEKEELKRFWLDDIKPTPEDIVVLLGAMVHNDCPDIKVRDLIKIAHPASKRSHKEMDEYVEKAASLICRTIKA